MPSHASKTEHLKASELEKGINLSSEHWRDQRQKRRLQKKELRKITNFFIAANIAVALAVVLLAILEHFHPQPTNVVTEKVLIAAIAGVTLQAGAIILAAFKGLFSAK